MVIDRRQFLQVTTTSILAGASSALSLASEEPTLTRTLTVTDYRVMRRFVVIRAGRIAYVDRGAGKIALFLHGFPLNSYQWRGIIPRVAQHRRCLAPDLLGLGFTEVADGQSVRPDAQVTMLAAFLDALTISTVDIIANDSGGAIAQLFVARHGKRVRTILLTNCDTEPDSPPAAVLPVIKLAREGEFADSWLVPWVADKVLARSAEGIGGIAFTYPDQLADDTIDYYLGPLVSSKTRKAQVNAYAVGLEPNPLAGIEATLKRCQAPVRVVWGSGDDIFSQASPEYLARTFARSRGIRRIPKAKLFFPEEFPDLIASEALKLWSLR